MTLSNPFKKPVVTVDTIVADLADKVTQLEAHAATQVEAIASADAAIVAAEAAKAAAKAEAEKASSVALKIRALLS